MHHVEANGCSVIEFCASSPRGEIIRKENCKWVEIIKAQVHVAGSDGMIQAYGPVMVHQSPAPLLPIGPHT